MVVNDVSLANFAGNFYSGTGPHSSAWSRRESEDREVRNGKETLHLVLAVRVVLVP